MLPLSADAFLARRLELVNARNNAEAALAMREIRPDVLPCVEEVAGGYVIFAGPVSPLTHALAIGLADPVTREHLERIEDFYRERDAVCTIDLCPHAHPSLAELLGERGYCPIEFENVLVRLMHPWLLAGPGNGIRIREAAAEEAQTWAETVGRGFFELDRLTREECDVGLALFHMPSSRSFFAEIEGQPAGGGGLAVRDNVAALFGASTLPQTRRRGVHLALTQARLAAGSQAGCTLATASTSPGSQSQRTYERCGFQVAYTRVIMARKL